MPFEQPLSDAIWRHRIADGCSKPYLRPQVLGARPVPRREPPLPRSCTLSLACGSRSLQMLNRTERRLAREICKQIAPNAPFMTRNMRSYCRRMRLMSLNDGQDATHEDVMALFDRTIGHLAQSHLSASRHDSLDCLRVWVSAATCGQVARHTGLYGATGCSGLFIGEKSYVEGVTFGRGGTGRAGPDKGLRTRMLPIHRGLARGVTVDCLAPPVAADGCSRTNLFAHLPETPPRFGTDGPDHAWKLFCGGTRTRNGPVSWPQERG